MSASIAAPPARARAVSDLLRLLPYLRPYRVRWTVMLVVAVLSLVATVVIPLMTKAVIDGPVRHRDQHALWVLGSAALAVGISEAILWFVRRWLISRATMGVEADIRKDLYARLQVLPMSFHGRWQSGQLLSRIMNDLSVIRRMLSFVLVMLVLNTLQICIVTAILLAMYWPLGVAVLVSVLPVIITIRRFERAFTVLSRAAQDQTGHVATHVEEAALGLRAVKSFGREDYVYQRFEREATKLYNVQIGKVSVSARFETLLEVIPNVTLIVVLGFGAYAAGHRLVTIGTLVAFVTMMLSLVRPIASLGSQLSTAQESMTAANRIAEIFDAPLEITDGPQTHPPTTGRLELRDVGFRFAPEDDDARRGTSRVEESDNSGSADDDARRGTSRVEESDNSCPQDDWVLRHVSVTVEPGQTLALVGATGSGKSVLAGLLPRLHDVTEGAVVLDGADVRELSLPALRRAVAVAFEDPTLFSMSVTENVTLGRPPDDPAGADEIAEALRIAAAQFVYDLPYGLDTRIGEQGMTLSGGQRQRLSLARAILARPTVLVLDDTLSALDVHTEATVIEALRTVLAGVTTIVVANRASTILLADKVALLDTVPTADGPAHTITHVGTHEELLAGVPRYRELLAVDDELDDGSAPQPPWESDDARRRLEHSYRETSEERVAARPPGDDADQGTPR